MFLNHEISADDILKRADLAMYQAKDGGRNAISLFDSPSPINSG
jgi:PleD family two-component response regulator